MPIEFGVAGFVGGEFGVEFAAVDDTDTDASAESDEEGATSAEAAAFGESGGAGVVGDGDRDLEDAGDLFADIITAPREVAVENGFVVLDRARESDGGSLGVTEVELGFEVFEDGDKPAVLVGVGREANRVLEATAGGEGREESFGAADVNR